MSANHLSILFFAAALLIGGTSVTALLLRVGAGPGSVQAVEVRTAPASFAGVLAAGSSSDTVPEAAPPAPAIATTAIPARIVPMRADRTRLRAVRARVRAEHAAHSTLLAQAAQAAEAAEARHLVLVEGLRSRRHLVVVARPEAREGVRAAAAALARRKS